MTRLVRALFAAMNVSLMSIAEPCRGDRCERITAPLWRSNLRWERDPSQGPGSQVHHRAARRQPQDDDHHLLAVWAADCAQHVLHHFEEARPGDDRPRRVIDLSRAWARVRSDEGGPQRRICRECGRQGSDRRRAGSGACRRSGRGGCARGSPRVRRCGLRDQGCACGGSRRRGSRRGSPRVPVAARPASDEIRELALDDQRIRNELCWFVFDCSAVKLAGRQELRDPSPDGVESAVAGALPGVCLVQPCGIRVWMNVVNGVVRPCRLVTTMSARLLRAWTTRPFPM